MKIKELIDKQKELAKICLDQGLFVKNWTFEFVFRRILALKDDAKSCGFLIEVLQVDGAYIAACVLDLKSRLIGVYVKSAYRRKGYGRQVLENLLQTYDIDRTTVFASDGQFGSKTFFRKCKVVFFHGGFVPMFEEDTQSLVQGIPFDKEAVIKKRYGQQFNNEPVTDQSLCGNQNYIAHFGALAKFFDVTYDIKYIAYIVVKSVNGVDELQETVKTGKKCPLFKSKVEALEFASGLEDTHTVYRVYLKPRHIVEFLNREHYDAAYLGFNQDEASKKKYMSAVYATMFYDVFFIRGNNSDGSCDLAFAQNLKNAAYSFEKAMTISSF